MMSEALLEVLGLAREHALASADESGEFVPFVWYRDSAGDHLIRAVEKTIPESVKRLRGEPKPRRATAVVLAYPGILTIKGNRVDAVILEGQDRSMDRPVRYGQPIDVTVEPIFGGYADTSLLG